MMNKCGDEMLDRPPVGCWWRGVGGRIGADPGGSADRCAEKAPRGARGKGVLHTKSAQGARRILSCTWRSDSLSLTCGSEFSSADLADSAHAAVSGDSADCAHDTDGSHDGIDGLHEVPASGSEISLSTRTTFRQLYVRLW